MNAKQTVEAIRNAIAAGKPDAARPAARAYIEAGNTDNARSMRLGRLVNLGVRFVGHDVAVVG